MITVKTPERDGKKTKEESRMLNNSLTGKFSFVPDKTAADIMLQPETRHVIR